MEDTLRDRDLFVHLHLQRVLILVLMEDTLRVLEVVINSYQFRVLILVLMEDTLRGECRFGRSL